MTESLALPPQRWNSQLYCYAAFRELRGMVLNSVASEHAKRNYSKALDEVYALLRGAKAAVIARPFDGIPCRQAGEAG
jgi:hypothetical protein